MGFYTKYVQEHIMPLHTMLRLIMEINLMYTFRLVRLPLWKNPSADRIPSLVLVSMSGL